MYHCIESPPKKRRKRKEYALEQNYKHTAKSRGFSLRRTMQLMLFFAIVSINQTMYFEVCNNVAATPRYLEEWMVCGYSIKITWMLRRDSSSFDFLALQLGSFRLHLTKGYRQAIEKKKKRKNESNDIYDVPNR